MNEQTRKALELARYSCNALNDTEALAAIDAALASPAAPVALTDDDLRDMADSACQEALSFGVGVDVFLRLARSVAKRAAPAAPVAQPLPACHVAVIGDRWDSEKLHHVPQLLIEFEPVPANTGNTAKGWVDRDALAKILNGIGQGGDNA